MSEPVLLVDTEPRLSDWTDALSTAGFTPVHCSSWDETTQFAQAHGRALVITRPNGSGVELARMYPGLEVVLSGDDPAESGDYEVLGAGDSVQTVIARLRRALRHREMRLELERLGRTVDREQGFQQILGTSAPMRELFSLLDRAAGTRASALITGESGTGKELVARALHRHGPRRDGLFVPVNCSAVPATLLESELFGHVRGAFTDARGGRRGLFLEAHRGTLFLDEIGDMPPALQPKLLRALQERAVRPVGGDAEVPVDVRVIAATNVDLDAAVARGEFRADLYYRLNVIRIDVPPLRDRAADILLLAKRFIHTCSTDLDKEVTGISRAAARRLLAYPWPGNVRELQNCLERAVALTTHDEIQAVDLPEKVREAIPTIAAVTQPDELITLAEVERRYIEHVMRTLDGNKRAAARVLGLDRKTLYRKLVRYNLTSGREV